MVDLGIPWWVISLIAVAVVLAAGFAIWSIRTPAVRAVALVLAVEAIAIAVLAPLLMTETSDATAMEGPQMSSNELLTMVGAERPGAPMWTPDTSIPPGAEYALIDGDPSKPEPYTLWLRMRDDYSMRPHWQPVAETITVLQGTLLLGMGETVRDDTVSVLRPGSVAVVPKDARHFFTTRGVTVIQVHGVGPLEVKYVNPADQR